MSKMQFNNTKHFDDFYNSFKLAEPSPFSKFIAETLITKKYPLSSWVVVTVEMDHFLWKEQKNI